MKKHIVPESTRSLCVQCILVLFIAGTVSSMPNSAQGQIFVTHPFDGTVGKYNLDGTTVNNALIAGLNHPEGIAVSGNHLFVVSTFDHTIGEYNLDGTQVNPMLVSDLDFPMGLAVSGNNLFVSEFDLNTVGEYTTSGATVNVALVSGLHNPYAVAASGNALFVSNIGNNRVGEYLSTSGATVNASLISGLDYPDGIAVSSDGLSLFVANGGASGPGKVGKYTSSGVTQNAALIQYGADAIAISASNLFVSGGQFGKDVAEFTTSGATVNPLLIPGTGQNGVVGIAVITAPEPASIVLLGVSLIALMLCRRARRR